MSADRSQCFQQCPTGHYLAYEKSDAKVPRNSVKDGMETNNEMLMCKLCAGAPYCIECSGPKVNDCLGCESGFRIENGQCVLKTTTSESSKIYILSITVCVLAIVLFVFLFLFLHYCAKKSRTGCCNLADDETLYSYVPNDDGGNGEIQPDVKFVNGNPRHNSATAALLTDSDDDRT